MFTCARINDDGSSLPPVGRLIKVGRDREGCVIFECYLGRSNPLFKGRTTLCEQHSIELIVWVASAAVVAEIVPHM